MQPDEKVITIYLFAHIFFYSLEMDTVLDELNIKYYFKVFVSFPFFLPYPFLTCCAIVPTSFGGREPLLRR